MKARRVQFDDKNPSLKLGLAPERDMQGDNVAQKKPSTKRAAFRVIFGTFLLFIGLYRPGLHGIHDSWEILASRIVALAFGFPMLALGMTSIMGLSLFGRIGHEQILDQRLEQRVRERYDAEIRRLTFLGFNYAFTESESFALYRIFLVLPMIALLMMISRREALGFGRGGRILLMMPICCSADGRTFAHPFALGVKFQTAFRNRLLLVTKNFKSDCCETPEFVVQAANSTIDEAWRTHQEWLDNLDTDTNPANRDRSYEAYVAISEREGDFQRSQQ